MSEHLVNRKPKSVAELLAEGQTPGQETEQSAPPVIAPTSENVLMQLVTLMMTKEAREAKKEQDEEDRRVARQKQRDRNAKDQDSQILLKQARCKHMKGGRRGPKTQNIDYAVYTHTYPNGEAVIRCQICGMRWRKQDTVEYLLRSGKKVSNHTHKGWREANAMIEQSTNTPSSCEIPFSVLTQMNPSQSSATDSAGLPTVIRPVDLEGREVASVEM